MLRFALIGWPVSHSRSPEIYRELFIKHGIEAEFGLLPVPPSEFASVREAVSSLDGFAVTMPYKRAIIPYLDALSPEAEACGAVNAVERKGGALIGRNTDGGGLVDALREGGVELEGSRVLILGRGGAARSAAFSIMDNGGEVTFLVRRLSHCSDIPEALFTPDSIGALSPADVFINASPLGMDCGEQMENAAFLSTIKPKAVFDMVYRKSGETLLVSEAKRLGIPAFDGGAMLYKQALRSFAIWFGIDPLTGERIGQ